MFVCVCQDVCSYEDVCAHVKMICFGEGEGGGRRLVKACGQELRLSPARSEYQWT